MSHPKRLKSPLILVSTSPQRREILNLLKIPFQCVAPLYQEEERSDLSPREEALLFAREKVKSVEHLFPNIILIGSDTLIEWEGNKIGKPKDFEKAREVLKRLKGKWHQILTAVCIMRGHSENIWTHLEIVKVKMKNYSDQEIENYLLKEHPYDKSGACDIQGLGRNLIEKLEGDYLAAIGLPLRPIAEYLLIEKSDKFSKPFQKSHLIDKFRG